jgi:AraC family transcriptional regulator
MKRKRNALLSAVLITAMSLFVVASRGQEAPFASLKQEKLFPYCCIAYKGPITDIGTVISRFMQAMQGQNLFPSVRGPMIGVYYNSPADTKPADLEWEVGFPVAEGTTAQPPLAVKNWKFMSVAVAVHKGAYAKTGDTIQRLLNWISEKGYVVAGPTLERYLNNPMQVKPEELLTEILIPVTKK